MAMHTNIITPALGAEANGNANPIWGWNPACAAPSGHRHLLRLTPARADAPEPDRGGRGRNEVQGWGVEAKSFPFSGRWKGSKSTRQPGSWSWHCHVGADGFRWVA